VHVDGATVLDCHTAISGISSVGVIALMTVAHYHGGIKASTAESVLAARADFNAGQQARK
jgi:hypothetical protein